MEEPPGQPVDGHQQPKAGTTTEELTIAKGIGLGALLCVFVLCAIQGYHHYFIGQSPRTSQATQIMVVGEYSAAWFLVPLLFGFVFLLFGVAVLCSRSMASKEYKADHPDETWWGTLVLGAVSLVLALSVMYAVPPSRSISWVDFDSQTVVEKDTYLYPRPNSYHQVAFSDIDYLWWDAERGDALVVEVDGLVFSLHMSGSYEEARRLAYDLSDLMSKPIKEVGPGG